MMGWRTFLARAVVGGAIVGVFVTGAVFVGVRLAAADPGGPTRADLTFAGVLRDTAALDLHRSPSDWSADVGFRCVIPR